MANVAKVATAEQIAQARELTRGLPSIASKIKALAAAGWERADIARVLTETEGRLVRYQWVKNVLDQAASKRS